MFTNNQIEQIRNSVIANDGISINHNSETPDRGYMVSKYGCETVYSSTILKSAETFNKVLRVYWLTNYEHFGASDIYLGIWVDGTSVYFDVSVQFVNIRRARDFAKNNKQLAFYDVVEQTVHRIDPIESCNYLH